MPWSPWTLKFDVKFNQFFGNAFPKKFGLQRHFYWWSMFQFHSLVWWCAENFMFDFLVCHSYCFLELQPFIGMPPYLFYFFSCLEGEICGDPKSKSLHCLAPWSQNNKQTCMLEGLEPLSMGWHNWFHKHFRCFWWSTSFTKTDIKENILIFCILFYK